MFCSYNPSLCNIFNWDWDIPFGINVHFHGSISSILPSGFPYILSALTWMYMVHHFTHKQCVILRSKYFLFTLLGELNPTIWKHVAHFHWRCLTTLPLDILITCAPYHCGSVLSILLNILLWPFRNVQVPLFGAVSVDVKPDRMISGWVGTTQDFHRGTEPTCCI